jgi:hypothetical protein
VRRRARHCGHALRLRCSKRSRGGYGDGVDAQSREAGRRSAETQEIGLEGGVGREAAANVHRVYAHAGGRYRQWLAKSAPRAVAEPVLRHAPVRQITQFLTRHPVTWHSVP